MHEISTPPAEQLDGSSAVVPFGTHKGRSVEELLVEHPLYLWWLLSQAWVWIRNVNDCLFVLNVGRTALDLSESGEWYGGELRADNGAGVTAGDL
jgi:hypothetical protein